MKKGEGWCVYGSINTPLLWTTNSYRKESLRYIEWNYKTTWAKLRRRGFTVRKVKLVEVSR